MKNVFYIFLALFPSFVHVGIRKLIGQKIGKKVKIKFGTLIFSNNLEIGSNTKIGPFTYINTKKLFIGQGSTIKSLAIIKTLEVNIANYVHIAPLSFISSEFTINSRFSIGDHSRIFPFCWLDTGEGINIGKHVGIGGHTLMFTHGVWSNYVDGGPVSFGPIIIEDNVWLPWRVFVMPNVKIGANTIVGANSLLNKNIEESSLVAGSPAKVIKKISFDKTKRRERLITILEGYSNYFEFKYNVKSELKDNQLIFKNSKIVIDQADNLNEGDLLILLDKELIKLKAPIKNKVSILNYNQLRINFNRNKNKETKQFVSFIRRYGVRLYVD